MIPTDSLISRAHRFSIQTCGQIMPQGGVQAVEAGPEAGRGHLRRGRELLQRRRRAARQGLRLQPFHLWSHPQPPGGAHNGRGVLPAQVIARTAVLPFYPPAVIPFALSFFTTCGAVASPLHGATPERRAMAYAAKPLVHRGRRRSPGSRRPRRRRLRSRRLRRRRPRSKSRRSNPPLLFPYLSDSQRAEDPHP